MDIHGIHGFPSDMVYSRQTWCIPVRHGVFPSDTVYSRQTWCIPVRHGVFPSDMVYDENVENRNCRLPIGEKSKNENFGTQNHEICTAPRRNARKALECDTVVKKWGAGGWTTVGHGRPRSVGHGRSVGRLSILDTK